MAILECAKGTGIILNYLALFTIVGYGTISYAPNLDKVAERRINATWGNVESVEGYDVLVAPMDCALLGRNGWLIVGNEVYRAIVVDCSQDKHKQHMVDNGLLLDTNYQEIVHEKGWLVLR